MADGKTAGGVEFGHRALDRVEKRFWRETPAERRATLMPFVWGTIATKGQIFGDPSKGGRSHVTNGLWFSYPGYNEMLLNW